MPMAESVTTTLVPRVKSFTNQYVTKATDPYTQNEKKIEKLTVLIFSGVADEQANHRLIYTQQANGSSLTLNKSELNTIASTEELSSATVVMFANVILADIMKKNSDGTYTAIGNSPTLEDLNDCSIHMGDSPVVLSSELETFGGFPMKGVATANLTIGSTAPIVVNLQILYAKVNFEINVAAGTENQALTQPSFTLQKFFVHNVAKRTSVELADGAATVSTDHITTGKEGPGSNNIFTFYIPESRYNPKANENGKIDLNGIYPTGWTTSVAAEDVKGYTDAMAAQLNGVKYFYDDLVQQYKPKLAEGTAGTPSNTKEGLATYVIVKGTYVDYRNTTWDVNYKIYLGKDNAQNFHVDRNSEYTNILTIKGIRNNDSYGNGNVWIDHRVNVELPEGSSSAADCVTITRETLIDAHIEVRPLRVKFAENGYTSARIYLPEYPKDSQGNVIYNTTATPSSWSQIHEDMGGSNENWIGIENNDGSLITGTLYCTNGKRKYFTTSLIEELHAESRIIEVDSDGNKYISLNDGDCAWIYFDENATSNARRAKIRLVFYTNANTSVTETYDVYQSGYTPIGDLKVENYEEYLHSYDSEESYNLQTSFVDYTQQGLNWGLESKPISVSMLVSPFELVTVGGLDSKDYIPSKVRYDYFHENDGNNYFLYNNNGSSWSSGEYGSGLEFTIRAANAGDMTVTDMGSVPMSAYEYCLSKNKFNEDANGNHSMIIRWYLPDVYELNSLFADTYTSADMAKDAYYWSSQPSSTNYGLSSLPLIGQNFEGVSIKNEVPDKARAVSKEGVADMSRSTTNRIRCFYDTTGESVDMSERVPSGLGGILRIPMTVRNNGFFNYSTWITQLGEEPTKDYDPNKTYKYPKGGTLPADNQDRKNADSDFDGKIIDGVHYYTKDPLDSENNWGKASALGITTYTAMNPDKWQGLSRFEAKEVVVDRYQLTDTPKTNKKESIVRAGGKITSMPDVSSVALDHNEGSAKLTISFNNGTNSSHSPTYEYYNETSASSVEWTKYWQVPTYTHIPSKHIGSPSCGKARPTYNENNIKNKIQNGYREGSALKRKVIQGNPTFIYTETEYIYTSEREARSAAENYFSSEINQSGKYKITAIQTPGTSVEICTYSYKGQTYKVFLGGMGWRDNGETGTGTYSETRYTWSFSYSTLDLYQYEANTGGWDDEGTKTHDGPIDPARSNVDALTMYGGNSFTISAVNGCKIKSIKVNFSDDNRVNYLELPLVGGAGPSDNRALRLVENEESLTNNRNVAPQNMSYSTNGTTGWFKWIAPNTTGAESITLKLVTYTGIFSQFQYVAPKNETLYESDLETSIVIDSFEIQVEGEPITTT